VYGGETDVGKNAAWLKLYRSGGRAGKRLPIADACRL